MPDSTTDALLIFGATGDLAYRKIFPSLQAMARRGRLDVPVIAVARSAWTRERLIERAKASVTENGGLDEAAFAKLAERLRYVAVDYDDAQTFARLKSEMGSAKRPAFYLAIPPSVFPTVIENLSRVGC